ncbi:MAG TPA: ferritin-like domain-containing protein, partial [Polyangiaceae bacterium]|nr:ferritin-like domain-containing protein [Polyangiaceae bacterium]
MSARTRAPVFEPRAVVVRAHLSGTPLSRRHEQTVNGKLARLPKPQPWAAFRETEHPRAARALATDFWLGVARGEYAAIGLFAELAVGLSRQGAPLDFVQAATQAATDETRHAELCLRMAACTAGSEQSAELAPGELGFGLPPLLTDEALDFTMLEAVAVSETLATALLTACQRRATDRLSKSLLTALVSDEVHHARLGWYYAKYRAELWAPDMRQRLARRVAEFV